MHSIKDMAWGAFFFFLFVVFWVIVMDWRVIIEKKGDCVWGCRGKEEIARDSIEAGETILKINRINIKLGLKLNDWEY